MSAVPWLVVTTWLAGALGLAILVGRDPRSWTHFAQALILGPWLLAVEMLLFGACGLPLSLPVVLLPWWPAAALAAWRYGAKDLGRGKPVPQLLVGLALAAFVAVLWVGIGRPITGGDPADNFGVFARVVASGQQLDFTRLQAGQLAGHLEYPPLVMLNEALYFQASPVFGASAVKTLFALQFLAVALLFAGLVRRVEARLAGVLLLALFLLQPDLTYFATRGFAELPLVAAFAWLLWESRALFLKPGEPREASWQACVAFALPALVCALTKNEGLMVAFVAAGLLAVVLRRPTVALVVVLGTIAWPLLAHFEGVEGGLLGRLVADFAFVKIERIPAALSAFLHGTFSFERWPRRGFGTLAWGTVALLGLALFRAATRRRALWVLAFAAAHIAIYALVFALTPRDFAWHLGTAADRLTVHFLPWIFPAVWLWTERDQRMKIGDDQAASPDSVTTRT